MTLINIITKTITTIITATTKITQSLTKTNTPQPINTPHTLSLLLNQHTKLQSQINSLQEQVEQITEQIEIEQITQEALSIILPTKYSPTNLIPNPELDEIYREQFPNNYES